MLYGRVAVMLYGKVAVMLYGRVAVIFAPAARRRLSSPERAAGAPYNSLPASPTTHCRGPPSIHTTAVLASKGRGPIQITASRPYKSLPRHRCTMAHVRDSWNPNFTGSDLYGRVAVICMGGYRVLYSTRSGWARIRWKRIRCTDVGTCIIRTRRISVMMGAKQQRLGVVRKPLDFSVGCYCTGLSDC